MLAPFALISAITNGFPADIMAIDLKKIKTLLLAGSLTVSLVMALTTIIVLAYDINLPAALNGLILVILALSPVPAVSTIVLIRALTNYAKKAETFSMRDPLTALYNQHTFWDLLEYETQRSMRQKYKFSLRSVTNTRS